ncbi:putative odorant receptor 69a [Eurosta solidaginis]|uniref:putative odorant receptor 69a n=1 Tax=Eurosta solidaginis TaxID=178769 RepID=UPI0035306AB9
MLSIYTLQDFLKYPILTLDLAVSDAIIWSGSRMYSYPTQWLRRALFAFGAINLIYQNLGMLIYLFIPHKTNSDLDVGQITETGGVMGLTMVGSSNMFVMYWYGDRIAVLIGKFQKLFPDAGAQRRMKVFRELRGVPTPYRIEYFALKSNLLLKRTTTAYMFACGYYNALPVVEYLYEWLKPGLEVKYRYQSNTWYPWQISESSTNSFVSFFGAYICQLQSSLTGVAFIMAAEFMLYFFTTQLQMHFDYLANALETIDAGAKNANDELRYLINYHSELLSYSKEVNDIFNMSFLVNFSTSAIAMCLMGFSMVMISVAYAFKFSVGLFSFIIFTLFICYTGSQLTEATDKLSGAAFYGNWYDGNLAYRKMILFFIMRCRIPVVLSAYKFTTVSMPTFTTILRSSYSLFTFFQAMGK